MLKAVQQNNSHGANVHALPRLPAYLGEGVFCIPPPWFQINTAVRMSGDAGKLCGEDGALGLLRPVGQAAASSEGNGKRRGINGSP